MQYLPVEKLQELSDKWLSGTISTEELELLEEWYNQTTHGSIDWEAGDMDAEQLGDRLFYSINEIKKADAPVRRLITGSVLIKAAATIIAVLGAWGYIYLKPAKQHLVAKNITSIPKVVKQDPNKAILTLANGSKVVLDNASNGLIAKQGNTQVNKTQQGELIYDDKNKTDQSVATPEVNMISTPGGGQYQVCLPDGSKVWLNALTSLKFPTAFTGNERVVELTGEAYFEVAKNKKMPFKVKMANNTTIEVLGTHFNIMAYENENSIKATLLEGSINVHKGDLNRMMVPGQEAKITDNIQLTTVNAEEAISWKNGLFNFDKSDIRTVMRQIERWYKVDVEYENKIPADSEITGYISRSSNLSEVLKMLELSGLKIVVEGKKLKVYNN